MKAKLLFIATLLFSFSINAQIDFEPHVTVDDTGGTNGANSVFVADLDGDGDLDMISASGNDDKIAWYENTDGQGNFGPQKKISETVLGATSVFAVDIDGDGDIDILVASSLDDTIGWFQNNGQGIFGSRQIISSLADGANSVYATDADADGDMDVFSVSAFDDKIAWYENTNGQGNFGPQQIISTNFDYPLDIVAGDIDGDGDMDILTGSRYNNSRVAWFKNTNGQGNFVEQQSLNTDINYCRSAILADVDGDGDLDIAATSWKIQGHRIIWFENTNGLGNFNNTPNIVGLMGTNARPETLYTSDFDNDGDLDIVTGSFNDGLSWFKNNGSGVFGTIQIIDSEIRDVQTVLSSDIDGNGSFDILIAANRADRIAWYKNTNGLGNFGPANVMAEINGANGAREVISVDLDGDGDKDLLSALTNDDRIAWQENLDGQGTYSELITIASIENPLSIFAGDINGDTFIDVFTLSSASFGKVVWYKNLNGNAIFGTEQIINSEDNPTIVYLFDVDNDGDLDVFSTVGSSQLVWQENIDGLGTFGRKNIIMEGPFVNETLYAEDIDNDGDKDLIAGYYENSDAVAWFENMDGQGNFSTPKIISENIVVLDSVYAADFDNDGDKDVIAVSYGTNEIIWYENADGQGAFVNEHIITSSAEGATDVFAKDLDNDGDIDIICAAARGNEIIYYLNDGTGNFNFQQTLVSNFRSASSVMADDFNNDGKIDILASAYAADEIIWFENRGPLSIEENEKNLFTLYPNPTDGLLNIKSITKIAEITIHNNLGQLLFTSEKTNQVDISTLNEGIYFVKIKDENGQTETKKVVKK
ncbi:hypothetical protein Aeqsu_2482 [Aequorivita sublithincola DSM 14238]|uniref:Secretion system C-terminal sorting domain-containing protein n=1 Tax=Aequorivita sublithincola (strain DSM 14238 / LMG 21431 / ACAM 643 / 9-3) TaxID=746697 RepID=I3YY71_AEQSU|nr:T9SS type A sorting domain-containing protein [Aequorivita sublithincola]AFL81939.1 hypothetical protein Aeqsu_2482 [Aequorivita sublithincola DSM 14238]